MPFFVYQTPTHIQIEQKPIRNLGELLRTFQDIVPCRKWVWKTYPKTTIKDNVRVRRKPFLSKAVRLIMSRKKRGKLHPNYHGMPEATKRKISQTMKGTRQGENNPMFGRKRTAKSRLKQSVSLRKTWKKAGKRRWCIDQNGRNHRLKEGLALPQGWVYGFNIHATSGPHNSSTLWP